MLPGIYHSGYALAQARWSEKFDGVRGYWDGQQLRTRGGHTIAAPAWFTAGWPTHPLDGELWAGPGRFAQALSAVRRHTPDDDAWQQLRYMVFDLPGHAGDFDTRQVDLQAAVAALGQAWVHAVVQTAVDSRPALLATLRRTVERGGEGLVLQQAHALYRPGRSLELVKLKPYDDAEAQVLGHVAGRGRLQGQTGALWVQWSEAGAAAPVRFKLGSGLSDALRRTPPAVGSWLTFRYQGLSAQGVPRFAHFVRPAPDPSL